MRRAVSLVACVALALASGAGAAAPFTPSTLAGTWSGTWKNPRFGSTGPAKIVAKSLAGNTQLVFTVDFGGNVFGCQDPPAEKAKPLTKGAGPGHWSASGFQIKTTSKAFGSLALAYKAGTGALTGGGKNPTCAAGLSWTVSGKFAGKKFAGRVTIKLADGTTAVSELALARA